MKIKRIICAVIAVLILTTAIPVISVSAKENVDPDKVYTMWGNNILMSNIAENGSKTNPDGTYVFDKKPNDRYLMLYSAIEHYAPDVIAFQECDGGWHSLIDDHEGYATKNGFKPFSTLGYANVLSSDEYRVEGVRNSVYYKTDKFELIDSAVVSYGDPSNNYYEDPWVFTWAILKDKQNGNTFAAVSTHISSKPSGDTKEKAEQIRELMEFIKKLEAEKNIPFIMMGDYNSDPTYNAYKEFCIGEKSLSARDVAKEVVGKEYVTANYLGQKPALTGSRGGSVIDHAIISTVGIAPEKYQIVVETFDKENNISTYTYADHVPQMLTFRIVGSNHKHTAGDTVKTDEHTHFVECPVCYLGEYSPHTAKNKCDPKITDEKNNVTTCSACGAEMKNHNFEFTSKGNSADSTHVAKCTDCNKELTAAKHVFESKSVLPTYANDGYTVSTCTFCKETITDISSNTKLSIPSSPFELAAGGQKTFYTGRLDMTAPVADGVIDKNEYVLKITDLRPENDETDDRFFMKVADGLENDIENVDIYISYNKNTIFIGAVVTDNDFCSNQYADSICIYIGTDNDTDKLDMFYLPRYEKGTVEAWPHDKELPTPQDAERESAEYVESQAIKVEGNTITYELSITRKSLCSKTFSQCFLSFIIRSGVSSPNPDSLMFVGFQTEGLEGVYEPCETNWGSFYPHVLKIGNAPKEEVTETEPIPTETEAVTQKGCSALLTPTSFCIIAIAGVCSAYAKKRLKGRK